MIKYKILYITQMTLISMMLITTGCFFGMAYSNYQHELIKQENLARVVKLMDCLQGKISCK